MLFIRDDYLCYPWLSAYCIHVSLHMATLSFVLKLTFSLLHPSCFFVFLQLMAKHAIDYSVFGGPQNFGKWMDVHSAPSCPSEVIKMSTSTVCRGLHVDVAEANAVRVLFC